MLLIIWDFDGTLANSEKKFKNIINNFLKEEAKDNIINLEKFTDDFYYKKCAGKKYTEIFEILVDNRIINSLSEDDLQKFLNYANKSFKIILPGEINLTKNMGWLLNKLDKYNDILMVIATSAIKEDFILKCKAVNNPIINKMNGYSCHELQNSYKYLNIDKYQVKNKPNPAIFIYSLENMLIKNNNISKILIIEDSSTGCKAGENFVNEDFIRNNNYIVRVIGYTAGDHKPDGNTLLNSGADIIINNAEMLLKYIDNFMKL